MPIAIDSTVTTPSRPVTPGIYHTRPTTPHTRPTTPHTRPTTPHTRPTTPYRGSGKSTSTRKDSEPTSPSNSAESYSNNSNEHSRNTASPSPKGRTLHRKSSTLSNGTPTKPKEPWRPPSKHPEIPPPPPSHLNFPILPIADPPVAINKEVGPKRPPWKPVGPYPQLPPLAAFVPTAKFQSKFEIRMRKCCGNNLRVIKQDPEEVYRGLRVIGVGCNGNVQRAHHTNNPRRVLALKRAVLDDDTEYKKYILRELKIMNFRQANLVNLKEVCLWGDQVWMGMELCTCSVFNVLCKVPRFEEGMAVFVVRECLKGLEYLHHMGYIHRDVKSENVLLGVNGEVKLADFGLSCPITPSPTARMGTSKWMAPEVIIQHPYSNTIDIWSLGIMLIELVDRVPPHHGVADDDEIYDRILSEPTPVFQRGRASVWLFALLEYMLERDGNRRPNAKEVLMALDESVTHSELTCANSQDLSIALRRLDMR